MNSVRAEPKLDVGGQHLIECEWPAALTTTVGRPRASCHPAHSQDWVWKIPARLPSAVPWPGRSWAVTPRQTTEEMKQRFQRKRFIILAGRASPRATQGHPGHDQDKGEGHFTEFESRPSRLEQVEARGWVCRQGFCGAGLGHHWDSDTSVVWTPPHGGPTHSLPLPPGGRCTQSFRPGTWLICLDRASVGLATQGALPAQPPQLLTLRSPKESRCPTSCCGPSTHNSLSISRMRMLQSQVPGRQPQAARA